MGFSFSVSFGGLLARRPSSVFASGGLERLATYQGYGVAAPFPHLVLDGLFKPALLRDVVDEFPDPGAGAMEAHNDGVYVRRKHNSTWRTRFGPDTLRLIAEMASPRVLMALEQVTGIAGLIPDPYLFGGGLHLTAVGGTLAVHADFNRHPKLRLDRRLNVLIYLNQGWTDRHQGWLELWDRDMRSCVTRIAPVFNRTAIFATTSFSYHGQPEPVLGPPGMLRRSVALYYYTAGRPPEEVSEPDHSTLWRPRPGAGF